MREIKFRGKGRSNNKWHYGYLWLGINKDIFYIRSRNKKGYCCDFIVVPESVGEFTGLKDKNGKEIYEGDIITILSGIIKGIVKWDEEEAHFYIHCEKFHLHAQMKHYKPYEVIGNIYENPELLKEV